MNFLIIKLIYNSINISNSKYLITYFIQNTVKNFETFNYSWKTTLNCFNLFYSLNNNYFILSGINLVILKFCKIMNRLVLKSHNFLNLNWTVPVPSRLAWWQNARIYCWVIFLFTPVLCYYIFQYPYCKKLHFKQ